MTWGLLHECFSLLSQARNHTVTSFLWGWGGGDFATMQEFHSTGVGSMKVEHVNAMAVTLHQHGGQLFNLPSKL